MVTTSSEPRRHHYIPQWYLRQFGTRDEIAVFDKSTGLVEVRRPRDVAFEIGFYDIDHPDLPRTAFETVLGNVENHAANAVRKLLDQGLDSLTSDQHEDLAAFVVTLQVRVPSARPAIENHLRVRLDRIRAQLPEDELRAMAGRDLTAEEIAAVRRPSPDAALPEGVMPYGVALALGSFVDQLLTDYDWSVVEVEPAQLISCDTPLKVLSEHHDGESSFVAELPLDQSHVLLLRSGPGGPMLVERGGWDGWFLDERTGRPALNLFQKFALMKAERYVFGHPDNPLWSEIAAPGTSRADPAA